MPRQRKEPKPIQLKIPPKVEGIDRWIVFGLDPSLSRTGYSMMLVEPDENGTHAKWLAVGSVKPDNSSDPVWVRSKAIALAARERLESYVNSETAADPDCLKHTGLIISFEAPTPGNDWLSTISRILHLVFFESANTDCYPEGGVCSEFAKVHVQMTNAATLRRLMGLTERGRANKKENIALAYTFLNKESYQNLDSDACDAVLMAMMAKYSASILLGFPDSVPERFRIALCNSTEEVVGKGSREHTRVKGEEGMGKC